MNILGVSLGVLFVGASFASSVSSGVAHALIPVAARPADEDDLPLSQSVGEFRDLISEYLFLVSKSRGMEEQTLAAWRSSSEEFSLLLYRGLRDRKHITPQRQESLRRVFNMEIFRAARAPTGLAPDGKSLPTLLNPRFVLKHLFWRRPVNELQSELKFFFANARGGVGCDPQKYYTDENLVNAEVARVTNPYQFLVAFAYLLRPYAHGGVSPLGGIEAISTRAQSMVAIEALLAQQNSRNIFSSAGAIFNLRQAVSAVREIRTGLNVRDAVALAVGQAKSVGEFILPPIGACESAISPQPWPEP